jgi:hypothetical protein
LIFPIDCAPLVWIEKFISELKNPCFLFSYRRWLICAIVSFRSSHVSVWLIFLYNFLQDNICI